MRRTLLAIALPILVISTGCSGSDAGSDSQSDDALASTAIDLKDYSLTAGIVATGPEARKLFEDMKASGATDVGEGVLLAGLNGEQLGFTDPDDKKEGFGISCSPKEADHTFHQDTCSLNAIVRSEGQVKHGEAGYDIKLTGKLAKAVALSLPRTSPAGLVGSMTTGSGKITCKTIPGPAGSECSVPIMGVLQTLDEAVHDTSGDSHMTAADAKKIVKAFF